MIISIYIIKIEHREDLAEVCTIYETSNQIPIRETNTPICNQNMSNKTVQNMRKNNKNKCLKKKKKTYL